MLVWRIETLLSKRGVAANGNRVSVPEEARSILIMGIEK
jgi:hypothetical protein